MSDSRVLGPSIFCMQGCFFQNENSLTMFYLAVCMSNINHEGSKASDAPSRFYAADQSIAYLLELLLLTAVIHDPPETV